jgi:SSS family solute:Na+ symporter
MASALVFGYLVCALVLGIWAGRRGSGGSDDFITGERSFGPVLMYFVMGAMVFSAYALLGTPQRVMAKGSDAFYALAYGAVALVPIFFFGAKVRRIGARERLVTQAEFFGARFASRRLTAIMGLASLLAFVPYIVIQFKGAGIVMEQVLGWEPMVGAALVYAVVTLYVMFGGMRGVGWTNVLQGVVMLVVVWWLGLEIPRQLFGGVGPMFDRVIAEQPAYLTLPGPGPGTSDAQWSAEVLLSILGFTMWPQVFMKCFTARSARLVQHSAVVYPTFLLFLVPLFFLGYAALLLPGAPRDERVLLWLVGHPSLVGGELMMACFSLAVLAASMSTGDALLHGGSSIFVRDVLIKGAGLQLDGAGADLGAAGGGGGAGGAGAVDDGGGGALVAGRPAAAGLRGAGAVRADHAAGAVLAAGQRGGGGGGALRGARARDRAVRGEQAGADGVRGGQPVGPADRGARAGRQRGGDGGAVAGHPAHGKVPPAAIRAVDVTLMTAPRILSSVCVLMVALGCERSSGVYDALDEPAPPFVALGPATPLDQLPKISDDAGAGPRPRSRRRRTRAGAGAGATRRATVCRWGCASWSSCSGCRSPAASS